MVLKLVMENCLILLEISDTKAISEMVVHILKPVQFTIQKAMSNLLGHLKMGKKMAGGKAIGRQLPICIMKAFLRMI